VKYEGAKGVVCGNAVAAKSAYRVVTSASTGIVYIAVRKDSETGTLYALLNSGGISEYRLEFRISNVSMDYYAGGSWNVYGTYVSEEWIVLAYEIDSVNQANKWRL